MLLHGFKVCFFCLGCVHAVSHILQIPCTLCMPPFFNWTMDWAIPLTSLLIRRAAEWFSPLHSRMWGSPRPVKTESRRQTGGWTTPLNFKLLLWKVGGTFHGPCACHPAAYPSRTLSHAHGHLRQPCTDRHSPHCFCLLQHVGNHHETLTLNLTDSPQLPLEHSLASPSYWLVYRHHVRLE